MPFIRRTVCVRRNATTALQRIAECIRRRFASPIVSRFLMGAICLLLYVAPAQAGFCSACQSTAPQPWANSEEFSEIVTCALLAATEPSFAGYLQKLGDSGASTTAATKPSAPVTPVTPVDQPLLPGTLIHGGAFADFSGRGLSGSTRSVDAGGSSAAGIFAKPSEIPISLLGYWHRRREFLFIPSGPPSDVFRPPPAVMIHS